MSKRHNQQVIFQQSNGHGYYPTQRRKYGFMHFLWDVFLTCCTGGLWLIWIFVREMRH